MIKALTFLAGTIVLPAAFGQTAQVGGAVLDPTQAAVPGVTVTATHEETGVRRATVSNERGIYIIPP